MKNIKQEINSKLGDIYYWAETPRIALYHAENKLWTDIAISSLEIERPTFHKIINDVRNQNRNQNRN